MKQFDKWNEVKKNLHNNKIARLYDFSLAPSKDGDDPEGICK